MDRLEQIVQILAEDQVSLQKLIADLATETRRGFDQVSAKFEETDRRIEARSRETDARFRETDERMRKTDERMQKTDERIRETGERVDKMVLAIGEIIRTQSPPRQ